MGKFQIDPGAGETFFGIITAVYSAGQAVASPIFGYWANKSKSSTVNSIR
jgi:hypothetical protein